MYLLDTNVVSELRKPRPHGGVTAWLRTLDQRDIYISAVTIGELQAGIEMTRRQDVEKAKEIEAWVDQVLENWKVLPMDAPAFRIWAKLMHRRSDDLYEDAMIAATAHVHNLKIATRNVKDFKHFGVEIVNPYEPP